MEEAMNTQQVQTVTNIMSGEKSYREVKYAITGVTQADLLSAIDAVINNLTDDVVIDHFMLATIFESLSKQHFESYRRQKALQESLRINNPAPVPSLRKIREPCPSMDDEVNG